MMTVMIIILMRVTGSQKYNLSEDKGNSCMKYSLHVENSSIGFTEAVQQW